MIIPKAIFLRNAYIKSKENFDNDAKIQLTLIMSILTRLLRNPQIHKLGVFSYFFPTDKFALLAEERFYECLAKMQKEFENAGYVFNLEREIEGVLIQLDWRREPIEYLTLEGSVEPQPPSAIPEMLPTRVRIPR